MKNPLLTLGVIAALLLSVFGLVGGNLPTAGAITSTTKAIVQAAGFKVNGTGGLTIPSSTGTKVSGLNFGTCYIQAAATTIAASSTATVDCQASQVGANTALTGTAGAVGITAGDNVITNFATTTPTTFEGLTILGTSASSTSGYITMKVYNGTGATFTWIASASTTQYRAWR